MTLLLSTAYLPPVQYITKFLTGKVLIEKHEHFQKQSYRNRCCIYGPNGMQSLVIPVKKLHGEKMLIDEVRIDYTYPWQHIHKKSIQSAYENSPFYEFYADEFNMLYDRPILQLFDWNMSCLQFIFKVLRLNIILETTTSYIISHEDHEDFRHAITNKPRLYIEDKKFQPYPYQQVFSERFGFMPNLSIIDLVFNEGPRTLEILKMSICQHD